MNLIKSFSVGNGDMFYIFHQSSNFTIIDCNINEYNRDRIVDELKFLSTNKDITRFISTHPDEDHLHGLKFLNEQMEIPNFYCVKNNAIEDNATEDFKYYCQRRDSDKAFYVYKDCKRKWMNEDDEINRFGSAEIDFLWPDINNIDFQKELDLAAQGKSFNNLSPIFTCTLKNSATIMWMGDIETSFIEKIKNNISWPSIDILFAPHHGRESGKVPPDILKKLSPSIIVIGEGPSEHLTYYNGYNTITQNSAGDILFKCMDYKVQIYTSKKYTANYLYQENIYEPQYIGTLYTKWTR
ncbi:hypothetical protein [Desulfovibrio piger]|uniref:hypothetical protein n=1 Tax=Desulfovibrio piger TaxID=901 RepID=UPI0026F222F1|nr:hypothetical protein [Desulfovibrio piger]